MRALPLPVTTRGATARRATASRSTASASRAAFIAHLYASAKNARMLRQVALSRFCMKFPLVLRLWGVPLIQQSVLEFLFVLRGGPPVAGLEYGLSNFKFWSLYHKMQIPLQLPCPCSGLSYADHCCTSFNPLSPFRKY
jgi:hypothetical protein